MQIEFYTKIKAILSETRLATYGQDDAKEVIILSRYLFNSALSQALYPSLQSIEICIRNTIDHAMSEKYGDDWLFVPPVFLDLRECCQISNAKKSLKNAGLPETKGHLIAELSFGFWTSLLDRRYERSIWQSCITSAFPNMPKSERTRKTLSTRFNRIRKLRNRNFHHGRIIHWKDLFQQRADIIEAIGWISPEVRELTEKLDTFTDTYSAGIEPWTKKIRSHWPVDELIG
jgi:hypothetical protein